MRANYAQVQSNTLRNHEIREDVAHFGVVRRNFRFSGSMFSVTELVISQRRKNVAVFRYTLPIAALGNPREFLFQQFQPFDFGTYVCELSDGYVGCCLAGSVWVIR